MSLEPGQPNLGASRGKAYGTKNKQTIIGKRREQYPSCDEQLITLLRSRELREDGFCIAVGVRVNLHKNGVPSASVMNGAMAYLVAASMLDDISG